MKTNPYKLLLTAALALALQAALPVFSGSIIRLYYDGISSSSSLTSFRNGLVALTNASIFPAYPTFREQLDDYNSLPGTPLRAGLQGKDNSGSDYGSFIQGYLEAPATGDYLFNIASDDNSALFLSTDYTEANKKLIAFELESGAPLFGGARQDQRLSAPVHLVRGQKYYLEVLHKQGAGASYIQVGWQRPDGVQEVVPALHLSQFPVDVFLGTGDTNQPPVFNTRGWNYGDLTNAVTVAEGTQLLLDLDVVAAQPTTYEWYRNGVVIPGEDLSFLRIEHTPGAWNGSTIQAKVSNAFGELLTSTATITVTPDAFPPTLLAVETAGNPNLVRITFSEAVDPSVASVAANYEIRQEGQSSVLAIQTVKLLADQRTVELSGAFGFRSSVNYSLRLLNIRDNAATPNVIVPNPTDRAFVFSAPTGNTYDFNSGRPSGFLFFGLADVTNRNSSTPYLRLTDNTRNQNGAVVIAERRDVDQVRIRFKLLISQGGSNSGVDAPGDGISVNIAGDLPLGTLGQPEEGFTPDVPGNRLSFTFDNHSDSSLDIPGFGVLLNNTVVTNVAAGVSGIPDIANPDRRWVDVDIDLRRSGLLTVTYDGVKVIDQLPTEFEIIKSAQISFAGRTRSWYQTHWIDDLNINYGEGDVGDAGLAASSVLSGTFPEGSVVKLSALPVGAGPFQYQWYKNDQPIPGETGRILRFPAVVGTGGSFKIKISNPFSEFTSAPGTVVIQPDTVAPQVVGVRGVAGGVNKIYLDLSEALDPESATDPARYSSPFFLVKSVALATSGSGVVLDTTPLRVGVTYPLNIAGVRDRSSQLNPLTTSVTFTSTLSYRDEILADSPHRYYRFEETDGTVALTEIASGDRTGTNGIYQNLPILGVPSIIPSTPSEHAAFFDVANTNYVTVPNGGDVNDFRGPWPKKSFEFWFKARTVPATNLTGLAATAGLYEEGGNLRSIHFYLWRDPKKLNPGEAELVFHAFNDTSDGPGSPFGLRAQPPVYVTYTVRTNTTYHVVGVFDGSTDSLNGEIRLYVNGALVARKGGVGQIYNHNGDVRIASGNARIHLDLNGAFGSLDGVIDDLSLFNRALTEDRIRAHYGAGTGSTLSGDVTPTLVTSVNSKGNPNQIVVTFNQPVSSATANNTVNYTLRSSGGAAIAVQSATLQPDLVSVKIAGNFSLQPGSTYVVGVKDVADILVSNNKVASTNLNFAFLSAGPVALLPASDLGDRAVNENSTLHLAAVVGGEPPYQYQWAFNGAPLPGQIGATLSIPAPLGAAGSYTVTVNNDFSSVTSPASKITVIKDTVAPQVVAVRGLAGSLNQVRLTFAEPVDTVTGTILATYSVSGLTVVGASLLGDGHEVLLKTTAQAVGQTHTVTVTGLRDRAASPNVLNTSAQFVSGIYYRDEVLGDGATRYWTFDETDGTTFNTLVSKFDVAKENLTGVFRNSPTLGLPSLVPNVSSGASIGFTSVNSNRLDLPNGRDIDVILGPWAKRTYLFNFQATSLPRITDGTNIASPALFAHGRVGIYLYATQDTNTPTQALLVFHIHNNASEGPGSPWGTISGNPATAKYVSVPIVAGTNYHVAAVLDGDAVGFSGQLRLYVNGAPVGSVGGIGQLYKHANDPPTFGQGSFLRHDGRSQSLTTDAYLDGVIDEFAILPSALPAARVAALYAYSQAPGIAPVVTPQITFAGFEGGQFTVRWTGGSLLQRATAVNGVFSTVTGASSPYVETAPPPGAAFYRILVP